MERPEEVNLSREDGEALIERLQDDALTAHDRCVLEQVLRWYFWLLFVLQEARFSLKRLRAMLFGEKPKKRQEPPPDKASDSSDGDGGLGVAGLSQVKGDSAQEAAGTRRPGHGRWGPETYSGTARVECRHEALAAGERCPVCGRGRLYRVEHRVEPGVDIRLDGHALLSAVRYVLEKFRCSACGQVFTAAVPAAAGAVLVLGRYYLGVPLYRLEGYQAMVGVPVSDATQWDQIERVADCAYPVFEHLKQLAAQGEVIYQDDTHVRILSLIAENRQADSEASGSARVQGRPGMHTTALVAMQGQQTICLYFSGRAHAGENLAALLTLRNAEREKPLVMSDALAANTANEAALIHCHCLAHGRRKFSELEETFPAECTVVIEALKQVFDHEEEARVQQLSATERFAYHQHASGPIMKGLRHWLEQRVLLVSVRDM